MEGRREVHDDAYWRLISIETPLLHTRCCRTDDLPHVILRHLTDVQLHAKRKQLSVQFRNLSAQTARTHICCTEHPVWPDLLSSSGGSHNASGQECVCSFNHGDKKLSYSSTSTKPVAFILFLCSRTPKCNLFPTLYP
jgi:hypothetical protein